MVKKGVIDEQSEKISEAMEGYKGNWGMEIATSFWLWFKDHRGMEDTDVGFHGEKVKVRV